MIREKSEDDKVMRDLDVASLIGIVNWHKIYYVFNL